jgi:hypothetical protein
MSADGFDGFGPASTVVMGLDERIKIGNGIISKFEKKHATVDVAFGVVGTLAGAVVPGASISTLVASVGLSVPLIYQPMAQELGEVYLADPRELSRLGSKLLYQGYALTAMVDVSAYITKQLAEEFSAEFLAEIAQELLTEFGIGFFAAFIPVVGGAVGAVIDYKVARHLTRIVGKMASVYYQNGAKWVGSRRDTYQIAKYIKGDCQDIRKEVKPVKDSQLRSVENMIELMRGYMNNSQMREALRAKLVPDDLIEEAMGAVYMH